MQNNVVRELITVCVVMLRQGNTNENLLYSSITIKRPLKSKLILCQGWVAEIKVSVGF